MDTPEPEPERRRWAKVIDQTRCIGCHACSTACKSENGVPLGVHRTYVKAVEIGAFPAVRRAFQVTRCNQCDDAPCTAVCPTRAMFRRKDGIVDFDKRICIGCKACIAACPYDAIFINPDDGAAEKCNFCAHRVDAGLEPACVTVCPTAAIAIGDLDDPGSPVARIVQRDAVAVRRPEKETRPKLFYKGAHQATLDPLAARRPPGGLLMWSEQPDVPHGVPAGHPERANSAAAARLAYDVAHRAPWDARVSLYTWTKGIAAGVYLVGLLLLALGAIDAGSALWRWTVPIAGLAAVAVTGAVLIADLDHPERFLLIFTRHHGRSWLVRGAFVLVGYGGALAAHLAGSWLAPGASVWLAIAGGPLAAMAAAYTAFLFAQCKARDLWQSPLLPPHLIVQAVAAGAAVLLLIDTLAGGGGAGAAASSGASSGAIAVASGAAAAAASGGAVAASVGSGAMTPGPALAWILAIAAAAHVVVALAEVALTHGTAHARLAAHEMTRGRYRRWFWGGLALASLGALAPWLPIAPPLTALAGLYAFEHADRKSVV